MVPRTLWDYNYLYMDLDGLKSRQFFVTMPKTKSRLFLGFRVCLGGLLFLVAEFISPKVYTFGYYSGKYYPKKCKVYPLSY